MSMEREALHITAEHTDEAAGSQLEKALYAYNKRASGHEQWRPMLFCLRDASGALRGGISGYAWGGWLHVLILWVSDELRGQGHGRALLDAAEAFARTHGCSDVHLTTFEFQAPQFYRSRGYECFAQLLDYPRGSSHYFMHKRLTARSASEP
jgi:GNAT superfamily N-acetyltransferase